MRTLAGKGDRTMVASAPFGAARVREVALAVSGLAACIPELTQTPAEFACRAPGECIEDDAGADPRDAAIASADTLRDAAEVSDARAGDARADSAVGADVIGSVDATAVDAGFVARPTAVAAGGDHTCVLYDDGEISCFGSNASGQSSPPAGPFVAVSAGAEFTCAVRPSGAVICFGSGSEGQLLAPTPATRFDRVSSDADLSCAREVNGAVQCWGALPDAPVRLPGTYDFVGVSTGRICSIHLGVDANGADLWLASCKDGLGNGGEVSSANLIVEAVAVAGTDFCHRRDTGEVYCGPPGSGTTRLGTVTFTQLAARDRRVCGIVAPPRPRAVTCYDAPDWQTVRDTRSTNLIQLSMGAGHTCGIRADRTVECWGEDDDGEATPPAR